MNRTGPRIRYWTPADVRAISNEQWVEWGVNIPWIAFAATLDVQRVLYYIRRATWWRVQPRV